MKVESLDRLARRTLTDAHCIPELICHKISDYFPAQGKRNCTQYHDQNVSTNGGTKWPREPIPRCSPAALSAVTRFCRLAGFLKMGNKLFAIPWEGLELDPVNKQFILNVDKDVLENATGFDKDNWPDMADPKFGVKHLPTLRLQALLGRRRSDHDRRDARHSSQRRFADECLNHN